MIEAINPLTRALVTKSLDMLIMRQSYIAQNIANASSVGYRPVRFEFEQELRVAADQGISAVETLTGFVLEASEPSAVRLDLELAESTQTALRFSGLVEVLGRQFALQRLIANNSLGR
jgi:flagellar basal-body rod protein FlgB